MAIRMDTRLRRQTKRKDASDRADAPTVVNGPRPRLLFHICSGVSRVNRTARITALAAATTLALIAGGASAADRVDLGRLNVTALKQQYGASIASAGAPTMDHARHAALDRPGRRIAPGAEEAPRRPGRPQPPLPADVPRRADLRRRRGRQRRQPRQHAGPVRPHGPRPGQRAAAPPRAWAARRRWRSASAPAWATAWRQCGSRTRSRKR